MLECEYHDFQNPPNMASRQPLITRIAAAGTSFSPLPRHALHGYRVTNVHRVAVEVGAEGSSSAAPFGAAAAAPLAGADVTSSICLHNITDSTKAFGRVKQTMFCVKTVRHDEVETNKPLANNPMFLYKGTFRELLETQIIFLCCMPAYSRGRLCIIFQLLLLQIQRCCAQ
jgi:hypothetical protein